MAARYFKKYSPATPAFITLDGKATALTFDSLDHILGYYGTDQEEPQKELLRMIREQRGGISEISKEEYEADYVQKKMQGETPLTPWREELSRSAGLGLVNREVVARAGGGSLDALAVKGRSDIRSAAIQIATPAEAPTPQNATSATSAPAQPEFKATLGQRKATTNVTGKNKNSQSAKN